VALQDYKNAREILVSNNPSRGMRFDANEMSLLAPVDIFANLNLIGDTGLNVLSRQKFEFHLYGINGEYIGGNQSSTYVKKIDDKYLFLDIKEDLNKLQYNGGVFRFVYNFLYDLVGSYNTDKLFISEISPSRTELKLKLQSPDAQTSIDQLEDFLRLFLDENTFYSNFVLNFGQNKIIPIANVASDGTSSTIYIKLFDPLPSDIQDQTLVWLSKELLEPYVDSVQIDYSFENVNVNTIRGPRTEIEELYWNNLESNYKSWTDLLSLNTTTSDKLENYINSVRFGVDLNLDFTNFKNFVFYGSAKERVDNFLYKVKLLEFYNENVSILNDIPSPQPNEILKFTNAINNVIRSFDSFERYLYYGDSDDFIDTTLQQQTANVPPYPKEYETVKALKWIEWAQLWVGANVVWKNPNELGKLKILVDSESETVTNWYNTLIQIASEYDEENSGQLLKTIPEHISITC
jgi:hypothetical protein